MVTIPKVIPLKFPALLFANDHMLEPAQVFVVARVELLEPDAPQDRPPLATCIVAARLLFDVITGDLHRGTVDYEVDIVLYLGLFFQ